MIALCGGHGVVHGFDHDGAAQNIFHDLAVLLPAFHQLRRDPHKARQLLQSLLLQALAPNLRDRQERRPSAVGVLQPRNGRLARLLIVHDDLLHGRAHGDFNGYGVLVLCADQRRKRPVNPLQRAPLGLLHHIFYGLGVALIVLFHFAEHGDAGVGGIQPHPQLLPLLLQLVPALGPGLQPQLIAADGVARGRDLVPGVLQCAAASRLLLLRLGQARLRAGRVPLYLVAAGLAQGQGLRHSRLVRPAAGKLRLQRRLTGRQLQIRAGQLVGAVREAFALALQLLQPLRQRRRLGFNRLDPRLVLPNLAVHAAAAVLRVGQLLPDARHIAGVVLHAAAEHGNLCVILAGFRLHGGNFFPQLVDCAVLLAQRSAMLLRGGIERVQRVMLLLQDKGGGVEIRLGLFCGLTQTVQRLQPHGHLQPLQLLAPGQIFFCLVRLRPQRLHLQLQLGNLVSDAHEVVLRGGKTALRLFLAVAVLGDARRLLKNLPAVHGTNCQNFVNFTLTDVGIALPAQAGVHKQLVDVPQAGGLLIDVELAVAGAVVAPGHHDLLGVHLERAVGVVQHQRCLGKAHLRPLLGAAEDDVLHLRAAQRAGALLTHYPADGVGNIRLSRPIRADNRRNIVAKVQNRLVRKGFEALNFQRFQVHSPTSPFQSGILRQNT